jgi:hypothetical protein
VLLFVFTLLLWGGSMLLQGWLYQDPAAQMPLRAALGGFVMAGFFTLWNYVDAKSGGGKYDTLFEFSPMEVTDHNAFDSVMKRAAGEPITIHYHKRAGSRGASADFVDDKGQPWKRNTSESMVVAILLTEKDQPEPTRFDANLDKNGNFPAQASDLRFTDKQGRYMTVDSLGRVYRKRSGVLFAALLLNGLHFVLWWMVLWLALRYTIWHAFGLAFVLWLFLMVAVQPVMFGMTR